MYDLANLLARMGQQQNFAQPMGYGKAPGMPMAPANPPKTYLPQWQGMGQRAEFGANFGADRGRNALLQMFQNRFRPQQQQQPPQYGIAPDQFRNIF